MRVKAPNATSAPNATDRQRNTRSKWASGDDEDEDEDEDDETKGTVAREVEDELNNGDDAATEALGTAAAETSGSVAGSANVSATSTDSNVLENGRV